MPEPARGKRVEELKDSGQQTAVAEVTSRPRRERRTYLFELGLLAVIGAFTFLTILAKSIPFFSIDIQITHALQSLDSRFFLAFMNGISWPGFLPQCFVISALIVLTISTFGFHWEAVAAAVGSLLPPMASVLIKGTVQRPRPTVDLVDVFQILDSYSFPSGHVLFYVGFFGFLWFLVYTLLKRSWFRTFLLIFLGSLIALVGVSRIYLGQHWASDVLGAYLLGSLILAVEIWFYRWGRKQFFRRDQVASEEHEPLEQ